MTHKINQHIGQHEVHQDHLLLFLQEDQITHSKLDLWPSLHFVRVFPPLEIACFPVSLFCFPDCIDGGS